VSHNFWASCALNSKITTIDVGVQWNNDVGLIGRTHQESQVRQHTAQLLKLQGPTAVLVILHHPSTSGCRNSHKFRADRQCCTLLEPKLCMYGRIHEGDAQLRSSKDPVDLTYWTGWEDRRIEG